MAFWDIAIVGGGPAGSAAAMTLRERYPSLSVGLLEASLFDEPRLGEVLSPAASSVLHQLKVADALLHKCARPVHASAVSWGQGTLAESSHVFTLHGPGWHLDRSRFDAMLAEEAERRGGDVQRGTRVVHAERADSGWALHMASGETATSRFVIDATGRGASIARAAGARIHTVDHLMAFACFFSPQDNADPRTLVESVEYGWWYTGTLQDGVRVAACMTDADIARDLNLADVKSWIQRLRETSHISNAVSGNSIILRGPVARSCASQYLDLVCGADWIAAGDAALALDPLSGQGILAALRSGIFAAYAAGDWLTNKDDSGLHRYQSFLESTRGSYLQSRTRYYSEEQRWPGQAFWKVRKIAYEKH